MTDNFRKTRKSALSTALGETIEGFRSTYVEFAATMSMPVDLVKGSSGSTKAVVEVVPMDDVVDKLAAASAARTSDVDENRFESSNTGNAFSKDMEEGKRVDDTASVEDEVLKHLEEDSGTTSVESLHAEPGHNLFTSVESNPDLCCCGCGADITGGDPAAKHYCSVTNRAVTKYCYTPWQERLPEPNNRATCNGCYPSQHKEYCCCGCKYIATNSDCICLHTKKRYCLTVTQMQHGKSQPPKRCSFVIGVTSTYLQSLVHQ